MLGISLEISFKFLINLFNALFTSELSNLLYYLPGTRQYSKTICRNIWNKIIRRTVFLQVDKYIGKDYYDAFMGFYSILDYKDSKEYYKKAD